MKKLTFKNSRQPFGCQISQFWRGLHHFLRSYQRRIALNTSCVYISEGKQQQHKHNLGTHDSKMADAVTNFHPTSSVPNLVYVTTVSRVPMFTYIVSNSNPVAVYQYKWLFILICNKGTTWTINKLIIAYQPRKRDNLVSQVTRSRLLGFRGLKNV